MFRVPAFTVEGLNKNFSDIEVDQEGNLFLLESEKHRLHKFFQNSGYDSVLTIGGKGLTEEGFNFPTKIVVPNRQNIYLLDYLNRRIVLLNTNLKVIKDLSFLSSELNFDEADSDILWPNSFVVGPTGELFLLNQENFRIYKINSNGVLERSFAGMDYGSGSVSDPWDLSINSQNLVFAVDSTDQEVLIFDLFGTFQYKLQIPMKFRWKRVVTWEKNLFFLGDHDIFIYDLFSKNGQSIHLQEPAKLIDMTASLDYFFLLFKGKVDLFRLRK